MNKIQKSLVDELLKPAFKEIKNQFYSNKCFEIPDDNVERTMGYNRISIIRKLGSEEYFRCQFYSELKKRLKQLQNKNKFKQIVIGVEGKSLGNQKYKKPDLFIADIKNIDHYLIVVELKVTGNYWQKKAYDEELKKYRGYCKANGALLCLVCYYESMPGEITNKLNHGKLKNNYAFNFIEGYAFPPVTKQKWIIDGEWY